MSGLARRVKKLTAETADAATRPEGLQHLSAEQLLQLFDGQEDPDHPDLPSRATFRQLSPDELCRAMGNYRRSMERIHGLRWEQLVEQEPELERLLNIARMVGDACRTWHDVLKGFSQFKNDVDRLTRSIVSRSPAPKPNGTAVWDVIYWKLHNAVAKDRRADN